MRYPSRPTVRLRRRRAEFPTSLARRHSRQVSCPVYGLSSTFLHPFAPGPLRPFLATMGALTPARSVAPVLGLFPAASRSAPREQVSLIHALGLPTIPSPTTCGCSASSSQGALPRQRVGPRLLLATASATENSGLRLSLAGSPHHAGRIEFVILRTGRSPPAASHPVSRRRSCSQLRVTLTRRGLSPLQPSALSGALAALSPAPNSRVRTPALQQRSSL